MPQINSRGSKELILSWYKATRLSPFLVNQLVSCPFFFIVLHSTLIRTLIQLCTYIDNETMLTFERISKYLIDQKKVYNYLLLAGFLEHETVYSPEQFNTISWKSGIAESHVRCKFLGGKIVGLLLRSFKNEVRAYIHAFSKFQELSATLST